MPLARFQLDVDAMGDGKVVVNDDDVTALIAGTTLYTRRGEVPELTLHLRPGASMVTGEGVVRIDTPQDMLEQLAQLLEAFDPHDLNQRALNSPDLDPSDEDGITRQVLREAARLLRARS